MSYFDLAEVWAGDAWGNPIPGSVVVPRFGCARLLRDLPGFEGADCVRSGAKSFNSPASFFLAVAARFLRVDSGTPSFRAILT